MSDTPLLAVEDLVVEFSTEREVIRAVDGVSFEIHAGETVGLVGESGSGKSVTARAVLGLIGSSGEIKQGQIRLQGTELTAGGWDDHRGDISIVFQDPGNSLNPVYSVGDQITEALKIHQGLDGTAARAQAIELLEAVGIPDATARVDEYPHQLSGGMQQRVVIAIALACDPDVLVCDEPTTALDVTIQAQILELLAELQDTEDLGILLITHDMGVIEDATNRVNVIYAGEIVERAPTDTLFAKPAHPYTQALLDSIPGRTSPEVELPTIEGEVPTPTGPATQCRFAPRCPDAFSACNTTVPSHISVTTGDRPTTTMGSADTTSEYRDSDDRTVHENPCSDGGAVDPDPNHSAACLLYEDTIHHSTDNSQ